VTFPGAIPKGTKLKVAMGAGRKAAGDDNAMSV